MILDIFSKRHAMKKHNLFIYDKIPHEFRVQVIHIWADAIGPYQQRSPWATQPFVSSNHIWEWIHKQLCKEYGKFSLTEDGGNPFEQCQYFIQTTDFERVLDIVELSFFCIEKEIADWNEGFKQLSRIQMDSNSAIEELNQRFREHGLGYQYINGQIVRVDSTYVFENAVSPAIRLLIDEGFSGASEEFMSAHEHFRHRRYKEAVNDALKSFESTMKTICKRMSWRYSETDPASKLIASCFTNGLVPEHLQSHFAGLRTTLESGLPTTRNKQSGHGQGEIPLDLPPHIAAYALHLAATNILFLVESFKQMKN